MGKNWKELGTLTLIGLAAWTSWAAKAQDEPNTGQSDPVAAPQASAQFPPGASSSQSPMIGPGVPRIRPSSQTSGFSSGVGTKGSVAQLRNPFEWEGSVEKHGLFGWIAPQPTPQYPGLPGKEPGLEPVAPPGGLPGEIGGAGVAQPGAVAGRAERKQCRVPEENLAQLRRLEQLPGRLRRQQPEQKPLPLPWARQDLGSEERLAVLRRRFP